MPKVRIYRGIEHAAEVVLALENKVVGCWWSDDATRAFSQCKYQIVAEVELPMAKLGDYHHYDHPIDHPGWGYLNIPSMGNLGISAGKWYYLHPSYLCNVTVVEIKELGRILHAAQ